MIYPTKTFLKMTSSEFSLIKTCKKTRFISPGSMEIRICQETSALADAAWAAFFGTWHRWHWRIIPG